MEKWLTVEGMHCMHCAGSVKKALEALDTRTEVDLDTKTAHVVADHEISDEQMKAAVAQKGFTVTNIR